MDKFIKNFKKSLTTKLEKSEIAALGILIFVLLLFPLAIFLSGLIAFFGFRYWKSNKIFGKRR